MVQGQPSTVTVVAGAWQGRRFDLPLYPADVVIGSDPSCSIVLPLPGVAPQHAILRNVVEGTWVLETGAEQGLYVNGEQVVEYRPIEDGDVLGLGATEQGGLQLACRLVPLESAPVAVSAPLEPGDTEEVVEASEVIVEEMAAAPDIPLGAEPAFDPEPSEPGPIEGDVDPFAAAESYEEHEPAATAAAIPALDDEFFVEEVGERSPASSEGGDVVPATPAVVDDAFFVGDGGDSEDAAPPSAAFFVADASAPVVPPEGGIEEDFFVADEVAPEPPAPRGPQPSSVPPPLPAAVAAPPVVVSPPVVSRATPDASSSATPETGQASDAVTAVSGRLAGRVEPVPATHRAPTPRPVRTPGPRPAGTPSSLAPRPAAPRPGLVPRPAGRRRGAGNRRLWPMGLVGAIVLAAGGYVLMTWLQRPAIIGAEPSVVRVGDLVTLRGERFGGTGAAPQVLFNGVPGAVEKADAESIVVRVPDLQLPPGQEVEVPVTVKLTSWTSAPRGVVVRQVPQIRGLSPDVAMSGEEVVIAGSGWGSGTVQVTFDGAPAQILEMADAFIRVRVPGLAVSQGTILPVVVSNGVDASEPAELIFGRLPVIARLDPREVAAGQRVAVHGRGFRPDPLGQTVRIGGVPALVAQATDSDLDVVVPVGVPAGEATLDVRVQGNPNVAIGSLTSQGVGDPASTLFVPEPFIDGAGHVHARISTPLGPLLTLAAAGGATAGARAIEGSKRLAQGLEAFRTSLDADLEVRFEDDHAVVAVVGGDALISVTREDAEGYSEGWAGRGGRVSVGQLANWWSALLRDYALMAMRAAPPHFTPALAPEGRVLAQAFDTMVAAGGPGLTAAGLEALRPQEREGLRLLSLRVPAAVPEPQGVLTTSSAAGAAATPAPKIPPLRLEGEWQGFEVTAAGRRRISAVFSNREGTLSIDAAVSVSLPMLELEPGRNEVRFMVRGGSGRQYYAGKWNGERIVGSIGDRRGGSEIGTFELWR